MAQSVKCYRKVGKIIISTLIFYFGVRAETEGKTHPASHPSQIPYVGHSPRALLNSFLMASLQNPQDEIVYSWLEF